ncbi:Guanylyl cyclase [Umbelopsis sp. PMI_123]|nr:Guanylyl cyclase [Umbelopsis sp. PMI_123]
MAYGNIMDDSKLINYSQYDDSIVPHIMQNSNWDCGLACIAMTMRALGKDVDINDLRQHCHVNSIWTIDLAFLLRNYVEDFTYYTSFLGSRKEYQQNKFYQETFSEDEKRVNKLFAIAKSCNVHVVRMLLPMDDFKRFLFCKKFAIITLVNARLLRCQWCQNQKGCSASVCVGFDSILDRMKGYEYIGHFIVLINYDPNDDVFIYRDPAQQDKVCVIQAEILDSARQSIGTDNDCIVIRI